MSNRLDVVVSAIVEGVRKAITEHKVTFEEYRGGLEYLLKVAETNEIPLLVDVFFNKSLVENLNKNSKASPSDLEGPYFLEDAPFVNGKIKTMEKFGGEPMLLRGTVKDPDGTPISDAVIDVWQSTPDGKYSGIHDNIPIEYYRGKLRTGPNGEYQVESTVPVAYQIPNQGPTGALLEGMGRHSWRPAHVHYKIRKEGFRELTTQAYFEGGDWVGDDCCEGQLTDDFVIPEKFEDDKRIMDIDFVIESDS